MKLLSYQDEAVRFVMNRYRETGCGALLDMDTGTGKTAVAIALAERFLEMGENVLVITIPGLDRGFYHECKKMGASFVPRMPRGKIPERWKQLDACKRGSKQVWVATYEMLKKKYNSKEATRGSQLVAENFGLIIYDESHNIKNMDSKAATCALLMSSANKCTVCMSGTPMLNDYTDYWSQIAVIDGTVFGKNGKLHLATFFTPPSGRGPKTRRELKPGMTDEFMRRVNSLTFRVDIKTALPELPPITRERIPVEMLPQEYVEYRAAEKAFINWFDTDANTRGHILKQMTKMRRLVNCSWTAEMNREGLDAHALERGAGKRRMLEHLLEGICRHKENKVIVWVPYRENASKIAKSLHQYYKTRVITGATSKGERDNVIKCFKEGETQVLVATPSSIGTGYNLQEANYMIFFGRDFSLANTMQAEARAYRKGSEMHKHIHRIDLYYPNSIDEVMMACTDKKKTLVDLMREYTERVKIRESKKASLLQPADKNQVRKPRLFGFLR